RRRRVEAPLAARRPRGCARALGASARTGVRGGSARECRHRRTRHRCSRKIGAGCVRRGDGVTGASHRTRVDLGERGYDVVVGADGIAELATVLAARRRAAIVTQATIPDALVARVVSALERAGVGHETFVMGDGEDNKTLATVDDLCRRFARWGL